VKKGDALAGATRIFGVPAAMPSSEVQALSTSLRDLWKITYGNDPHKLENDLELCKNFFDPSARERTLRERISQVGIAPSALQEAVTDIGEPLIVDAGDGRLIVGVEARLLLDIIEAADSSRFTVISIPQILAAERQAVAIYRRWATRRLHHVIALSSGKGSEVLQAIAVGVVISLLVNRSTIRGRAIVRFADDRAEKEVSKAIFNAAGRFAEMVGNRSNRSASEMTLKSGYGLTEASRRLAHRLVIEPSDDGGHCIYVAEGYEAEVVTFLARDLARRKGLSTKQLESGFDELVRAFRAGVGTLANRAMVFERATDTQALRGAILDAFNAARADNNE
jgi:hypothetical protein